jgi:imidazolonepropionase-like amidohydrolase
LIDGTGSAPQPDVTVIVRAGRIEFVGPAREKAPGSEFPAIDGRGKFLLPGLIDTHAHVTYLNWSGEGAAPSTGTYDDEISRASLRLLLAFGITTVRNPGGPTAPAVALRDRVGSGKVTGPFILTAGEILNHAPRFDGLTRPVTTDADVQREVAAQAVARVDFVKIYGNLPPELVRSAIHAAHDRGLKVIGHLQATSWTEAAHLGIDAIAHGASWSVDELPSDRRESYRTAIAKQGAMRARLQWLDDVRPDGAEIQTMIGEIASRRIPVDPTLIAYATKLEGRAPRFVASPDLRLAPQPMRSSFDTLSFVRDWSREDFDHGRRAWPKMQALVRAYHRGGVLLTAGSDEPNSWIVPGPSLHTELELLVEAGLSPLEVLTIATRNGAESLGILNDVGTVSIGKRADLILLDADPTRNIRNTRTISLVVQNGRPFAPSELR